MVFTTIMTRDTAGFLDFFEKTQAGTRLSCCKKCNNCLRRKDINGPRAAILADPLGQHQNYKYLLFYLIDNYQLFII